MDSNRLSAEDIGGLYERHGAALVAYACGFGLDRARAEDAVHAVFQRLLSNRPTVTANQAGYLYRAVSNAALNARRDRAREASMDESCFFHRNGDREGALALEKALGELPEEQREVVIMRIWSGMTLEEIAAATEHSLNTVASRYRYALGKLRERMQPFQACGEKKNKT